MQQDLFDVTEPEEEQQSDKGAFFSMCGKYRYALWRIWDRSKPLVMFIGLNPSTANQDTDDPTIESVVRISKHNGYGGFYMMNCFAYVSTNPDELVAEKGSPQQQNNNLWLRTVKEKCVDVVFAWGNFKIVSKLGRDLELLQMFPKAKFIVKNKNGTPGHPLFKKGTSALFDWEQ